MLGGVDPKQVEAQADEKRRAKLPALFDHFDIDPDAAGAWERLAMALAAAHVPGFRVASSFDPGTLTNPFFSNPFLVRHASGAGIFDWQPPKRGRGRPKNPLKFAGGTHGLLGGFLPEKRKGGRPSVAREEKAEHVELFEAFKAHQGQETTDEQAAKDLVSQLRPELNSYNRRSESERIVRLIRRWRNELRRFENSPENQE